MGTEEGDFRVWQEDSLADLDILGGMDTWMLRCFYSPEWQGSEAPSGKGASQCPPRVPEALSLCWPVSSSLGPARSLPQLMTGPVWAPASPHILFF